MSDDSKNISISLPGEWILQKTLGPVLLEIGDDLKHLYAKGRDRIIEKAYKKIENPEDNKSASLRIAHDVLTNGAFTNDEICAEYFGGVLASSRSDDDGNDDAIQLLNTIKSLSSKQLYLHYIIYNSLNKLLTSEEEPINVGQSDQIQRKRIWFNLEELNQLKIKHDTDLNILHRLGLVESYQTNIHTITNMHLFPYACVSPTTYGVLLYSVAHNALHKWRLFSKEFFPDFDGVTLPHKYAFSLDKLIEIDDMSHASFTLSPPGTTY